MAMGLPTISIHTVLADGDPGVWVDPYTPDISIHTVLADGDFLASANELRIAQISIHTVLADGDAL